MVQMRGGSGRPGPTAAFGGPVGGPLPVLPVPLGGRHPIAQLRLLAEVGAARPPPGGVPPGLVASLHVQLVAAAAALLGPPWQVRLAQLGAAAAQLRRHLLGPARRGEVVAGGHPRLPPGRPQRLPARHRVACASACSARCTCSW